MKGYSELKSTIGQIIGEITSWLWMIVSLAIAAIFFASAVKAAGYPVRFVPTLEPTALAYLCGAYWLARK
jgi:hypothetical protein